MTAPAQILANALQCAVDAVCNFARFVVNESRTRLTPPPPPPPPLGICGSIAAAARIFGLVLLTAAGALAGANDALAQTSCPNFHESARDGDLAGVRCNLDSGADVNLEDRVIDSNNDAPLHFAAQNGHLNVVSLLLKRGANVNAKNRDSSAPLHLAAFEGHAEIASTLLAEGADADPPDNLGTTPLHWAASRNNLDVVNILLAYDADVNAVDRSTGQTPLGEAQIVGANMAIIFRLIREGGHYGSACEISETVNPSAANPPCLDGFTVSLSLSAGGTVLVSWRGDSDVQGDEGILSGAMVTFTALPGAGYQLTLWTGDCEGDSVADLKCVRSAAKNLAVGAEFGCLNSDESTGACRIPQDCAAQSRAQTNEYTCGACLSGFTEGAGACQANQDCAAGDRVQTNAFTCGACLSGFTEDAGACQANQDCAAEGRVQTNAFTCGACLSGFTEDAGACQANQDCAAEGRVQTNAFTCGACLSDFTEDAGACQANQDCAAEGRVQTNAFTCGACLSGFTEDAGSCQANQDCAAEDRVQANPYTCGDCLSGFTEVAEACQENQDCAAQGRVQTNAYACGACLPDFRQINRHCIHPENRLPEDETTCADAFGGEWVDLSAEYGDGKGVCSGIDINDTFCLAGTGSALPCLGLFNHVRSCNLLGRPALDPWHCAAACAGGKASGARCLE